MISNERMPFETETEKENIVLDGSVDLQGRPVERAKTGGIKACSFLVGYEFCERLAYGGIWANLVIYFTTKLHEGTVSTSRNVTIQTGTMWSISILAAYIADTHWGRYWTFLAFSSVYIVFKAYMDNLKEERKKEAKKEAAEDVVFPCVLSILPNCIFNKEDPIIVGVDILEGIARIVGSDADEAQKMFDRHFEMEDEFVSHLTRRSIDILKGNYRDDLSNDDWKLGVKLKKLLKIP